MKRIYCTLHEELPILESYILYFDWMCYVSLPWPFHSKQFYRFTQNNIFSHKSWWNDPCLFFPVFGHYGSTTEYMFLLPRSITSITHDLRYGIIIRHPASHTYHCMQISVDSEVSDLAFYPRILLIILTLDNKELFWCLIHIIMFHLPIVDTHPTAQSDFFLQKSRTCPIIRYKLRI